MARKPNYSAERNARAKAKAAKREAKRAAKLNQKAEKQTPDTLVSDVENADENQATDQDGS
jgi:hypothetical protein